MYVFIFICFNKKLGLATPLPYMVFCNWPEMEHFGMRPIEAVGMANSKDPNQGEFDLADFYWSQNLEFYGVSALLPRVFFSNRVLVEKRLH